MKINKNFFFLYLILISFLNNFSFGAIPQSSNIVAYYPFSGDATDSSGNGYDGEITGDPQLTTDRFGNSNSAYIFDGDGDWIYFGTETLPQIMEWALGMLLLLVSGQNHPQAQQWICLLLVE